MAKLLLSVLFISCLVLVKANVIPNHINSVGVNHNTVNVNALANAETEKMRGNPIELCFENCMKGGNPIKGVCKYKCEQTHLKRASQSKYDDCMTKCSSSPMSDAQSPVQVECRQGCDKSYPRNVYVY